MTPEGRFTKVNDTYCEILGRTRDRLLSMSLPEVTHPDEVNRVITALKQVLEKGELTSLDKKYVRPDGTIVYANCSLTRIDDEKNLPQAILSVTVDMTENRRASEFLEQRVAERTELAEARTKQLQSLAVELIEAEERERQRISALLHEDLQQVLAAARFQVQAVQESLPEFVELSEVEQMLSGAIFTSRRLSHDLSPSILHHSGLVAALAWLSGQMHERFVLEVQVNAEKVREPDTAYLKIFMFRAAQELLFNVVKHAGVQSAQVHLFASDLGLSISVSDQGKGFEPAILESSAATTGLGLLSLRERASYVGGTFLIESAPGQGSRITITVPATFAREEQKRAEPMIRDPSTSTAGVVPAEKEPGIRVMLVDDHKVMRQGLIRLITGQPDVQVVGEADSGQEAIELARQIKPDVIIMDVSMPEMDGIEATRRIKNELPETRVIGLSMFEDEHVTKAMRQAGAEVLVSKSSSMSELLKAIYGISRNQHRL
jgi:PAS domain S-box-containing protein